MENGIIVIEDVERYNLPQQKVTEITGGLTQIIIERNTLSQQYDQVIRMDIEDPQTSKAASALRKLIKNNRTKGVEAWHKTEKEYFLRGGQFVDAIKKKEVAENVRMEDALEQIENHFILKEKARIDALEIERKEALVPYQEFVASTLDLRSMSEADFSTVLNGARLLKADNDKRLAQEEADRVAKELAEKTLNARLLEIASYGTHAPFKPTIETTDAEWKKLLKEAKKNKEEHEANVEKQRIENERLKAEAEKSRKENEAKLEAQRKEQAAAQAIADAKLKAEQDAKAKLQAELKAKADKEAAEAKAKQQAEEEAKRRAEELAKAPIKDQLNQWVNSFSIPGVPVDNAVAFDIVKKFGAFRIWASDQIKTM
jgi:colicin import membrane protein